MVNSTAGPTHSHAAPAPSNAAAAPVYSNAAVAEVSGFQTSPAGTNPRYPTSAAAVPAGGNHGAGSAAGSPASQGQNFLASGNPQATGGSSAGRGGRSGRQAAEWDATDFLRRLEAARQTQNRHNVKAVLKEVAENNYDCRFNWQVPRTDYIKFRDCTQALPGLRAHTSNATARVTFSDLTTADALKYFASKCGSGLKVCALNFANGKDVGGGYKNGASAQEEDLCRRFPGLYTSLFNAKRANMYPFGPTGGREVYADVLWTPDLALARGSEQDGFPFLTPEEQVCVNMVAAAAPNLNFAKPPDLYDRKLMYDAVVSIFVTPRMMCPSVNTLILGAWGCGAFGGDPKDVSELFCRAIQEMGSLYEEIHFAIPVFSPQDENAMHFKETFTRHGITFFEEPTFG